MAHIPRITLPDYPERVNLTPRYRPLSHVSHLPVPDTGRPGPQLTELYLGHWTACVLLCLTVHVQNRLSPGTFIRDYKQMYMFSAFIQHKLLTWIVNCAVNKVKQNNDWFSLCQLNYLNTIYLCSCESNPRIKMRLNLDLPY